MDVDPKARRRAEVVDEVSKWTVGAGILAVALAPLAIPILVLTGVALLPLALPLIPIALVAGLVYLPVRVIRGLRARNRSSGRGRTAEKEVLRRVELETLHGHLVK